MILAVDSSSITASVALVRGPDLIAESFQNSGLTHSQTLAPMIECMLRNCGVNASDIKSVVVTNGPGSFTGLRIGVSAALGWACAAGIPCAGVSSLEAAAWAGAGQEKLICAVMDARRGEVYNALFRQGPDGLERICPDRAVSADELKAELGDTRVLLCGDYARALAGPTRTAAARPHVSAYGAAMCALAGHTRPAAEICYLRLPQAERELLAKSNNI